MTGKINNNCNNNCGSSNESLQLRSPQLNRQARHRVAPPPARSGGYAVTQHKCCPRCIAFDAAEPGFTELDAEAQRQCW